MIMKLIIAVQCIATGAMSASAGQYLPVPGGEKPANAKAGRYMLVTDAHGASAPLRVMSYNIRCSGGDDGTVNCWDDRKDDLADLIERESPDVVGFQEVTPESMEFLARRFPAYTFVGEFRQADRKSGEASPVAYRSDRFAAVTNGTFWLSETPDVPGSKSWGSKFPRICSWAVLDDKASGKRFAFANTHTDHKSEMAREKGMLLAIERMKEFGGNCPIVFTGDHNCREDAKPSLAVSKVLDNALYACAAPPEGSWRTFNHWTWHEREVTIGEALKNPFGTRCTGDSESDEQRIDYVYVTHGTKVLSYRTIPAPRPGTNLYPSDHFPIVADIVLHAK